MEEVNLRWEGFVKRVGVKPGVKERGWLREREISTQSGSIHEKWMIENRALGNRISLLQKIYKDERLLSHLMTFKLMTFKYS